MADDSNSTPQPNINLYNVASDDALWVLETDHDELVHVLANPRGWVNDNVKVGQDPAVVWEPFVVVFHEVAPSAQTTSVPSETAQSPIARVQGIHKTSVLTVRYSRATTPQSPKGLFPEGEILAILKVGNTVHTHLQYTGFSQDQVANSVFASVSTPEAYIAAMNELPQTLNGDKTPDSEKMVFALHSSKMPHVVYQGWSPKKKAKDDDFSVPSDSCAMSNGDANSQGQVIVDGIVVKTYTLNGPGG